MRQKNKIYNQLSYSYGKLFIQNIQQFSKHIKNKNKYTVFYPTFGIRQAEQCDFLIYGQALNGGDVGRGFKENGLKSLIEWWNSYYEGHTPLDWVNVYWSKSLYEKKINTKELKDFYEPLKYTTWRSFFWNVTYKLICDFSDLDKNVSWEWTKKMVWSNLYKISPAKGGNPSDDECKWQELSHQLIQKEIEEINPRFCIVMTNDAWWEPFRMKLGTIKQKLSQNIESVEKYNNTTIIVTKRSRVGKSSDIAKEILQTIKKIKS